MDGPPPLHRGVVHRKQGRAVSPLLRPVLSPRLVFPVNWEGWTRDHCYISTFSVTAHEFQITGRLTLQMSPSTEERN